MDKKSSFINGFWDGLASPVMAFTTGRPTHLHSLKLKSRRDPAMDAKNIREDFLRAFSRYDEETAKTAGSQKK